MLARTDTVATIAESWLQQFEGALAAPGRARLKTLFHPDSHWRDVLALTWHIKTVNGLDAILRDLTTHAGRARPTGFKIDQHRTAPRNVTRAGTDAIEAIFSFETTEGRDSGVLRLTPDANDGNTFKAWTLLTSLDEIKGHEERLGRSRPQSKAYSRDFRGPNWLDIRKAAAEYRDCSEISTSHRSKPRRYPLVNHFGYFPCNVDMYSISIRMRTRTMASASSLDMKSRGIRALNSRV